MQINKLFPITNAPQPKVSMA